MINLGLINITIKTGCEYNYQLSDEHAEGLSTAFSKQLTKTAAFL